ncbi:MAG TPA: NHL repeat-containing protein [Bacteroidota bacterium]
MNITLLVLILVFLAEGWESAPPKKPVTRFGNFSHAASISVDPQGDIYVVDAGSNRVAKFSSDGTLRAEVGGYGWGDLEFDQPYGISASSGLNVYVADYGNHRVQRFDSSFNFISTLFLRDDPNLAKRFGYPTAVALSRQGDLYIGDGENSRILKVTSFNDVERAFGGFDAGLGRLVRPRKIVVGPEDRIYVLDADRVVVFDNFGNYVAAIGKGRLRNPTGLAYAGKVYVVDGDSLHIFEDSGNLSTSLAVTELVPTDEGDPRTGVSEIVDIAPYRSTLYLLTVHEVVVSSRSVN